MELIPKTQSMINVHLIKGWWKVWLLSHHNYNKADFVTFTSFFSLFRQINQKAQWVPHMPVFLVRFGKAHPGLFFAIV